MEALRLSLIQRFIERVVSYFDIEYLTRVARMGPAEKRCFVERSIEAARAVGDPVFLDQG